MWKDTFSQLKILIRIHLSQEAVQWKHKLMNLRACPTCSSRWAHLEMPPCYSPRTVWYKQPDHLAILVVSCQGGMGREGWRDTHSLSLRDDRKCVFTGAYGRESDCGWQRPTRRSALGCSFKDSRPQSAFQGALGLANQRFLLGVLEFTLFISLNKNKQTKNLSETFNRKNPYDGPYFPITDGTS